MLDDKDKYNQVKDSSLVTGIMQPSTTGHIFNTIQKTSIHGFPVSFPSISVNYHDFPYITIV